MLRSLFASVAVVSLFALSSVGAARAEDDNKCKIAIKDDNAVVQACKVGGIKRAKATMKAMTKVAKEKGKKWDCNDCHKDESEGKWDLTKDGEKLFKEMLALVK